MFVFPTNAVDESGGTMPAEIAKAYADMEAAIANWNPHALDSSLADSMYAVNTNGPSDAEIKQMMTTQANLPSSNPLPTNASVEVQTAPKSAGNLRLSYSSGIAQNPTPTTPTTTFTLPPWVWLAGGALALMLVIK